MKKTTKTRTWNRIAEEFKAGKRNKVMLDANDRPMVHNGVNMAVCPDFVVETIPVAVIEAAKANNDRFAWSGEQGRVIN